MPCRRYRLTGPWARRLAAEFWRSNYPFSWSTTPCGSGQVRAEIAEIERTYVPPSVYAARLAQQSRNIKDQVMATPGVKEVFVAAEQRQSPAERTASALERQASEIRAQEERMQIAQAHDLVVRQRLADLQKLEAFIESKLK